MKEARQTYDLEFFKQFSFQGKDSLKLAQKGLEEYIQSLEDNREIQKLMVAMVSQSYELNQDIPNIELLIYKMFCSPLSTKEARKEGNDSKNLLLGNIFDAKGVELPLEIYNSLLHTVMINPKKKHFKKILAYLQKNEPEEKITPALIDKMFVLGIKNNYPVTIGQLMRDLMTNGKYHVHQNTFIKLVMYLERCKGFEEDAKKFLYMTSNSKFF